MPLEDRKCNFTKAPIVCQALNLVTSSSSHKDTTRLVLVIPVFQRKNSDPAACPKSCIWNSHSAKAKSQGQKGRTLTCFLSYSPTWPPRAPRGWRMGWKTRLHYDTNENSRGHFPNPSCVPGPSSHRFESLILPQLNKARSIMYVFQ